MIFFKKLNKNNIPLAVLEKKIRSGEDWKI